ncbi:hypothetical protein AMS68_008031 [Peltaster fructicola]|uniref:Early meiotic induction protein 1 n=1 Tax=Peltaster fructicola TaxID=286661 RepID=A0A6H0Y656_9PEZI|nr:hypothetical protein AMS68_008031 [Peltaster fructicola]
MWPFGDGKPATPTSTTPLDTSEAPTPHTRAEIREATRIAKNERADHEFAEFIKSFQTTDKTPAKTSAPQKTVVPPTPAVGGIVPPVTKPEVPEPETSTEPRIYADGTIDIRPEVMHPRSMNCRQQFDQAFYCQSLGGKFNDIYRYGELKSCSEQWGAFWFCMRTRTLGEDAKAAQTMEYYQKRDDKKRQEFGSSEDVWDIRTRSVERAFWRDPDEKVE